MSDDFEFDQWLQAQPLDTPIEIDGETVYLKVHQHGAELGVYLIRSYVHAQLQEALKQGFQSALYFDAGLAQTEDGNDLVLTQWLPHVADWSEAAESLADLLVQLDMWRAALTPNPATKQPTGNGTASRQEQREEERIRMLFAGAKS